MNQQTSPSTANIINNIKTGLHIVTIGLSVISYIHPNVAILTVGMSVTNALYHILTQSK
jgi:hypothetical protein